MKIDFEEAIHAWSKDHKRSKKRKTSERIEETVGYIVELHTFGLLDSDDQSLFVRYAELTIEIDALITEAKEHYQRLKPPTDLVKTGEVGKVDSDSKQLSERIERAKWLSGPYWRKEHQRLAEMMTCEVSERKVDVNRRLEQQKRNYELRTKTSLRNFPECRRCDDRQKALLAEKKALVKQVESILKIRDSELELARAERRKNLEREVWRVQNQDEQQEALSAALHEQTIREIEQIAEEKTRTEMTNLDADLHLAMERMKLEEEQLSTELIAIATETAQIRANSSKLVTKMVNKKNNDPN